MSALSLCHWDFNRVPDDSNPDFLTASIAIFQWQPKASGKGLKKVNACRVCGYMLSRHDLYVKAQELCDRLNAEGGSALAPPQWLQKTYSVPRPRGLVIPRGERDLPGSVVRSIRLRVMKRILLPAGFVKGQEGTYVRRVRDQIHLIDFQAARFGHEYVVNLAFHYSFVPPLFASKKIKLADYSQLDCGLRARTGDFTSSKRDQWFPYGMDRAKLEQVLEDNAAECLRAFDISAKRFADPAKLLRGRTATIDKRAVSPWRTMDSHFAPLLALSLGRHAAALQEVQRLVNSTAGNHFGRLLARAKKSLQTSGKLKNA